MVLKYLTKSVLSSHQTRERSQNSTYLELNYLGYLTQGNLFLRRFKSFLEKAKTVTNTSPPRLILKHILNYTQIHEDYKAYQKLQSRNFRLLKKLNQISRNPGDFYPFHRKVSLIRKFPINSYKRLKRIESENFKLGCKILTTKSSNYIPKGLGSSQCSMNLKPPSPIPKEVIDKYENYFGPEVLITINEFLRPRIYMDFENDDRVLGRIIVELFVEACPEVCLHFIRMCTYNKLKQFKVIRIFPDLWTEAEISVVPKTLHPPKIEYSMNAINHGEHAGVFSFSKNYIDGFPQGLINFSMSFRSISACNGKRVPFALIVKGLKTLKGMQSFGSKLGKIKTNIKLVKCGIFS